MPAKSEAQRKMMAIAEHHPEELYERNRGVLEMTKEQLSDFASTKEKGLPEHSQTASAKHKRKLKHGEFKRGGYDWRDYD